MEHKAVTNMRRFTSPLTSSTPLTVARYALEPDCSLTVREVLPFTEQVRRALISHRVDTAHSETITGKTADGVPLIGHLHAHYFATDEDGDGCLDHITIYAPRGFDAGDIEALKMIRSITRFNRHWRARAFLIGIGRRASFNAPLFGTSKRWCSITPFSLPRFATRGAGKRARRRDLPEAQLMRELRVRGLPEPVFIERIEGYVAGRRPPVRWLEFEVRRFNGTTGYGLAGFEIEFSEAVTGPLALGFGG